MTGVIVQSGGARPLSKAGPRILVVDDEPDILSAVRGVLEATLKAEVHVASSGEEGLELLRRVAFDLIVTDFKMPGMNGVEFVQRARAIVPGARVLLITAFERELVDEVEDGRLLQAVLLKPLSPKPLVQTVQRILAAAVA